MNYEYGRVINDADSHTMETADWIYEFLDEDLRDKYGDLYKADTSGRVVSLIEKAKSRAHDPEADAAAAADPIGGDKGWLAFGAFDTSERTRMLDKYGFVSQLVFTTASLAAMGRAENLRDKYALVKAANMAQQKFCDGDKRLVNVAYVPLDDADMAFAEAKRAIDAGAGAVGVAPMPCGNKSPGHPDHDAFWQMLSDRSIPFMVHIGTGTITQPKGYHNNGRERSPDIHGGGENLRFADFTSLCFAPQEFLTAMVYDGVFDRFPDLRGGVIESGAGWVPDFLRRLDYAYRAFGKTDQYLKALAMKPSDYIRRAVKFTPFPKEDVGAMIREAGPELFMFSSDFPHPEGTKDPVGLFEATMDDLNETEKDMFYRTNYDAMMNYSSEPLQAVA
ncbi:amidohydrolase family protein [Croceicoccus sp. YJ47]|uniref:amidohydrolase family protein n=1 Tax=Croceicoccus sp. YJ47 TaxID=2798724 RepID=UPI0019229C9C|nr:amidohydrolase family protein [Croceicoccus sp. YJ47]QQN75358.1 amidohydrolase family protein [Croceicoccus sp. YJ47]